MTVDNPTLLDTTTSSSNLSSLATASISPSANALLIVVIGLRLASDVTPNLAISSIVSTLSGLSAWNWVETVHESGGPNEYLAAIAWATCGPSPGSGTITITPNNTLNRWNIHTYEVAGGYDTSTPIAQSKTNTGAASSLSVVFDSAPASDSLVVGGIVDRNGTGITPGSGYTEGAETTVGSGPSAMLQSQYKNGSATDTVSWSTLFGLSSAAAAIEIAAVGPAASGITRQMLQHGLFTGARP